MRTLRLLMLLVIILIALAYIFQSTNKLQSQRKYNYIYTPPVTQNTNTENTKENEKPSDTTPLPPVYGPQTVTLGLNQTATLFGNAFSITPLEIVEDSRCPVDAQCIWAGTFKLRVRVVSGLGKSEQVVELDRFVTTEAEKIELIKVVPENNSMMMKPLRLDDYRFTFVISKR